MGLLNSLDLNKIEKLATNVFNDRLLEVVTNYQLFTDEIPVTENEINFEWIGALGNVREWVGSRHYNLLTDYSYTINPRPYELTYSLPYKKILDLSKTKLSGMALKKVKELGAKVKRQFPAKYVFEAIEDGTTDLCFDGQPFFDNAHPNYYDANTFDNLLAGSGVTSANLITDVTTAITTLAGQKNDGGEALNLPLNVIVCNPLLAMTFMGVLADTSNTGSAFNIFSQFGISIVSDARLTDTNDWYAFSTEALKPIVSVQLGSINLEVNDARKFSSKLVDIGADVDGKVGYGYPQTALKFVNA